MFTYAELYSNKLIDFSSVWRKLPSKSALSVPWIGREIRLPQLKHWRKKLRRQILVKLRKSVRKWFEADSRAGKTVQISAHFQEVDESERDCVSYGSLLWEQTNHTSSSTRNSANSTHRLMNETPFWAKSSPWFIVTMVQLIERQVDTANWAALQHSKE